MKIDEKTLSILGAPKEGFEWVEVPDESLDVAEFGAYIVTRGADVTISHYRQVPIGPEPEVILYVPGDKDIYPTRILTSGEYQTLGDDRKGWATRHEAVSIKIAETLATQHKELKALKEKLEAWKAFALATFSHVGTHCAHCEELYDKAVALEVAQ